MEQRLTKSEDTHTLPSPQSFHYTNRRGRPWTKKSGKPPQTLTPVCIIADSEKNEVLQIKVQVTFIQNYSEKKIEGKSQNILGDENTPPPTNIK